MLPQAPLSWLLISSSGDKVCVCVREGVRTGCLELRHSRELGEAFSRLPQRGCRERSLKPTQGHTYPQWAEQPPRPEGPAELLEAGGACPAPVLQCEACLCGSGKLMQVVTLCITNATHGSDLLCKIRCVLSCSVGYQQGFCLCFISET